MHGKEAAERSAVAKTRRWWAPGLRTLRAITLSADGPNVVRRGGRRARLLWRARSAVLSLSERRSSLLAVSPRATLPNALAGVFALSVSVSARDVHSTRAVTWRTEARGARRRPDAESETEPRNIVAGRIAKVARERELETVTNGFAKGDGQG